MVHFVQDDVIVSLPAYVYIKEVALIPTQQGVVNVFANTCCQFFNGNIDCNVLPSFTRDRCT